MALSLDPERFVGFNFTRRLDAPDDYSILIDGLVAGRIYKTTSQSKGIVWFWTLTGPAIPIELGSHNGIAPSLEEAQDLFKQKFKAWQKSATKAGAASWNMQ